MKKAGQIILFRFPQTDLLIGKLRPALLICKLPNNFDDYLVYMISSRNNNVIKDFDEVITSKSDDFVRSGLKVDSVFRIARLAVIQGAYLLGTIGEISEDRIQRIKFKIANWINDDL